MVIQELTCPGWMLQPWDAVEEHGRLCNWIPEDSKVQEGKEEDGLEQSKKDTRSSLQMEARREYSLHLNDLLGGALGPLQMAPL